MMLTTRLTAAAVTLVGMCVPSVAPTPTTAQLIPGYCSTNVVANIWLTESHGNLEVFTGISQSDCCGLCSQWIACVAYLWVGESAEGPATCVFRDEMGIKDSMGYPKPGGVLGWIEGRL